MRLRPWSVFVALAATLAVVAGLPSPALAAADRVLVIAADEPEHLSDVVDGLYETGRFSTVTVLVPGSSGCHAGTGTLSEATLEEVDAVFVYGNCAMSSAVMDEVGDLLADFVDAGGTVVVAHSATSCLSGVRLGGRWAAQAYDAFAPSCDVAYDGPHFLLPVVEDHPLLAGVGSFWGGSITARTHTTPQGGATVVATWSDLGMTPLLAQREIGQGIVVGLNAFPVSSRVDDGFWSTGTDGWTLFANALQAVPQPSPQPQPAPDLDDPVPGAPTDPTDPADPAAPGAPAPGDRPAAAPAHPVTAAPTFTG